MNRNDIRIIKYPKSKLLSRNLREIVRKLSSKIIFKFIGKFLANSYAENFLWDLLSSYGRSNKI